MISSIFKYTLLFNLLFTLTCYRLSFAENIYDTYINSRFSYTLKYPKDIFYPQGEADNGDGQKFLSKDKKSTITVYGGYNIENKSIKTLYQDYINNLNTKTTKITYTFLKSDYSFISGYTNDLIFYKKTTLKNDVEMTLLIEYPIAQRLIYDKIINKIANNFP